MKIPLNNGKLRIKKRSIFLFIVFLVACGLAYIISKRIEAVLLIVLFSFFLVGFMVKE